MPRLSRGSSAAGVNPGSIIPWETFARTTTEDSGALYEFLHSLTPVEGLTADAPFRREAD